MSTQRNKKVLRKAYLKRLRQNMTRGYMFLKYRRRYGKKTIKSYWWS